ncbi:MAG: hypothetical protein ACRC9H_10825 [Aeromonas veronii]
MYRVDLLENEIVLESKEFSKYEKTIDYSNRLLDELKENRTIVIHEKKNNEWIKFKYGVVF